MLDANYLLILHNDTEGNPNGVATLYHHYPRFCESGNVDSDARDVLPIDSQGIRIQTLGSQTGESLYAQPCADFSLLRI